MANVLKQCKIAMLILPLEQAHLNLLLLQSWAGDTTGTNSPIKDTLSYLENDSLQVYLSLYAL